MFILVRKETPLPDGGTQVDESRQYFNKDAVLIRELRKSGRFKPGESIAEALKEVGPPAFDPFATVKGDSEKFRLIHRTVSPDGRYAIALGFGREQINWDEFVDRINIFTGKEEEVKGEKIYTDRTGEEDLRNYVVDLAQQKILGETGCGYFSTEPGPLPGHISCEVEWSPDSTKFVQEWEQKTYIDCVAGQIAPGPKLIGVVDLGKEIDKRTSALVKKSRDPVAVWLDIDQVSNDGGILIKVEGVSRADERKDETLFSLSERLRLRETPAGLRLETVSVRNAPKE